MTTLVGGPLFHHASLYAPAGDCLLVPCGPDIKVFSTVTGSLVRTIREHSSTVTCLKLSPDYKTIFSCSISGEICLFSVADENAFVLSSRYKVDFPLHQVIPVLEGNMLLVSRVVGNKMLPDTRFAKSPHRKTVSVMYMCRYDRESIVQVRQLKNFSLRLFVDLTEDGQIVCADKSEVSVNGIDWESGKMRTLKCHRLVNPTTCMSACSSYAAVGDTTGRITIWWINGASGINTAVQTLHWHSDIVLAVRCLFSGYLLSGGRESVLVLWRVSDQHKQFLPKIGESLEQIAVQPTNNGQFAASTRANKIVLVEASSFRPQACIEGISGLCGDRDVGNTCQWLSDSVVLVKGSMGVLQAFDVLRDQSQFSLPVVELLLTDPSSSQSALSSSFKLPDIEAFACNPTWIVTAEGRLGMSDLEPHLGYVKMWNVGSSNAPLLHTVVHNPHIGPVSDISIACFSGHTVICSVSPSDTFKIFKLTSLYDSAILGNRDAWRVLYADPLARLPNACSLSDSGLLAVAYERCIVVLDIKPLILGDNVGPTFVKRVSLDARAGGHPNSRCLKRVRWAGDARIVAATDGDLFLYSVDDDNLLHWSVCNHQMSVRGDGRILVLSTDDEQEKGDWLLEFDAERFSVVGRRRLEGDGRAVLALPNGGCMYAHGDGFIATLGAGSIADKNALAGTASLPKRNVLGEVLRDPPVKRHKMAKSSQQHTRIVKSRSHLYSLLKTRELPDMRSIFRAFIIPRITAA